MTMDNELLDFCRVKKIDEKGYGFLKGIHYPNDIFFHFSQIKRDEVRDKLEKMKRGDFFLFFISKLQPNDKRKVFKLWYSLKDVPDFYYPPFIENFVLLFEEGKTNLFDLFFVLKEMKEIGLVDEKVMTKILGSKRVLHLPTTILPFLTKDEFIQFKEILNFAELQNSDNKPYWFDDFVNYENTIK